MTENSSYELFITEEESIVLEAIAQSIIPYSQRAQALLAIDAGSSVGQAGGVAGLRVAQVRYWIGRFRNDRLQVFPEELLKDIEALIKEREKQDKSANKPIKKKSAKKTAKGTSKKKTSGSGKKDKKKLKGAKKKKAAKSKDQKKTKGKKAEKAKVKKDKKKKTAKKK